MRDKDAMYGLMIPFLFIWGMCGALLVLVIALFCIENESTAMGIFLILISIARLFTNTITDDTIYKNNG